MGRPKVNLQKPHTAERLLSAAEEVFGRSGFRDARLEDIAASAGITRPSLLYHYRSKDELYGQVVRRSLSKLRAALADEASAGGEFPELLERLVAAYVDFLQKHPQVAAVLLREMLDGRAEQTQFLLDEVVPLIDWIEQVVIDLGKNDIRANLAVRPALLQVSASALMQHTAGAMRRPIWGNADHTVQLAKILFLEEK